MLLLLSHEIDTALVPPAQSRQSILALLSLLSVLAMPMYFDRPGGTVQDF